MKTEPIRTPLLDMQRPQGAKEVKPGFKETLLNEIAQVNADQNTANRAMEELASGKTGNIHETMIAIQKAEVSFKMLVQVRNKVISAYQEVMRMQV